MSDEHNWADKRESIRLPTALKVLGGLEGQDTIEVQGDVSIGGARARLPYVPAVLRVKIELAGGLVIPGEFFNVRPAAGGGADVIIRFKDLDTETELKLAKLLDDAELSKEHDLPPPPEAPTANAPEPEGETQGEPKE